MKRELETWQRVEQSIQKKYRKTIWGAFVTAVKQYELVKAGDKIAVCISGGKDSMLMAKLMQMLQRHSDVPFELVYLVMDPGYNELNRAKIEQNAAAWKVFYSNFSKHFCFGAGNKTSVTAKHSESEKLPFAYYILKWFSGKSSFNCFGK